MTASRTLVLGLVVAAVAASTGADLAVDPQAQNAGDDGSKSTTCAGLPSRGELKDALSSAREQADDGSNLPMWATLVNRDGVVCAVVFSGIDWGDDLPEGRVLSAQKANTANAFSLPGLALATANLYSAVQPGGSLYGLQHSDPVNTDVAERGPSTQFGTEVDPMLGHRIGGVNVFGGGLALYAAYNNIPELAGAIGVSGDTPCADHNNAWQIRHALGLDHVPPGVSGDSARPDNIVYDITHRSGEQNGVSESGWGHPECTPGATATASALPPTRP